MPTGARPWLAAYPEGVPADIDVPPVPLHRLLTDAAQRFPAATAVAFLDNTHTYREMAALVERFAGGLSRLGVGPGDRVALVLPNCPQNVVAFFAVLRLGAIAVQHNPLTTVPELAGQLADSGASIVICLDRTYATVAAARDPDVVRHVVVTSLPDLLPERARRALSLPLPSMRRRRARLVATLPAGAKVETFRAVLRAGRTSPPEVTIDPAQDPAVLLYTGGTTGSAKGAILTHRNLVANAHQVAAWIPDAVPGGEVTLAVLPLFHSYGLTLCLTTTVLLAGALVLLPTFDLDLLFDAIDEHHPTLFPGVPPIFKAMLDSPAIRQHDLSSIRACVSGAMRLPVETQRAFERATGVPLVEGYGMTETSPVTHANPLDGTGRPGSIGLPLPGTDARIVDAADPTVDVPAGDPGELVVRGPQVFPGYWGRAEQEGVFTDDGWLLTGDIAVMDDDGSFTVVDRKKELIIAGGFNIYPSEVEDVLRAYDGVADCAVVGVPDRYRGETVKAFVVGAEGVTLSEADLKEHCAQRLTAYKIPKLVEFRSSLPRSSVGKPLRRVLLDEELSRGQQP